MLILLKFSSLQEVVNFHGYDTYPTARLIYEGSAEGRIKQQFGPGKDWHTGEKAVCADYLTNSNTEVALNARLYRCSETTLTCSGNYRNGSLPGSKNDG